MRKLVMLIAVMACIYSLKTYSQDQGVQWKKFIGDKKYEGFTKIVPAADGGYLLIGNQEPIAPVGTYIQPNLFLVKVNAQGAVEWQKTYGGSGNDWGISGISTADGGFIILGASWTYQNDGDVNGHHGLDPTVVTNYRDEHQQDVWILKINAQGSMEWAKSYGGSRWDTGRDIIKTNDGNYMIAGKSHSWDGDLTGIRRSTEGATGRENGDMWIFKINDNGSLLWQKCFGGNYDEQANHILTKTNGYLFTGWTTSNDLDVIGLHNAPQYTADAWVVDIDNNGNIVWAKTFGGSSEDYASNIVPYNSGYLVAGTTRSNDGDVVGFHQPPAGSSSFVSDIWLFELNASGNLTWQLPVGTSYNDGLMDVLVSPDNNVTLIGIATLNNPGFLYNTITAPLVFKLDNNRNIVYQKTLYNLQSTGFNSITTNDFRNYYIGGAVSKGKYKFPEEHINGVSDAMVLKFGDVNTVTGKVFIDYNGNNSYDSGDELVSNARVVSAKNGDLNFGSISNKGIYGNQVDTGSYTTSVYIDNPNYSIAPTSVTSIFSNYFDTATIDFALTMIPGRNDLQAVLLPLLPARPGFQSKYGIKVSNKGTTTQDAIIKLVKDPRLSILSSVPVGSIVNDTLTWSITGFAPFKDSSFTVTMEVAAPPTVNNGDTLLLRVEVSPVAGDVLPADNADTLKQRVTGSYDPNDKTETHGGVITPAQISGADYLTYLIRYQNTGTDTAFNITVRDTLDNRLDWSSLQMIASSHSYQLSIEDGNKLAWQFNNIKLPYTGIDEPGSHGYIAYRIKPQKNLLIGDTIKNTAGIYFDYNLPISTNTEKTVVLVLTPLPVTLTLFDAALDGTAVNVTWQTSMEENLKHFEIQRSSNGVDFSTIGTVKPGRKNYLFKDKQPVKGYNYYRLRSVDVDGSASYSPTVLVNLKSGTDIISSLYPNPVTGNATLKLQGSVEGNVLVQVLDQQGRLIATKQFGVHHTGEFKAPLDLGRISKGSYVLRIIVNNKTYLQKLLIQ